MFFVGVAALIASLLFAKSKLSASVAESKKVAELVQVALAKLKEQVRHYPPLSSKMCLLLFSSG